MAAHNLCYRVGNMMMAVPVETEDTFRATAAFAASALSDLIPKPPAILARLLDSSRS